MASQNIGTLSLIKATTPALTLGGLTTRGVNPNIQQWVLASDGDVDPTYSAVAAAAPGITFTTTDLKAFLDACGIAGCQIAALDTYFQQIAPYGTRKASTDHLKLSFADGMMVPRQITAGQGQPARLAAEIFGISSDDTCPLAKAASQSLPAGGGTDVLWTLGKATINGTDLVGIQNMTIDFGLQVQLETSDGDVFPSLVYIMARRPTIRLTTRDSLILNTLGVTGLAQSATDSIFYLRKADKGATRVADATAEHIAIAIDDGRIQAEAINDGEGQQIGTDILVTPTSDGENAIMAVSTTSAIT